MSYESHPVRVRGLKQQRLYGGPGHSQSHPVRVRGLKPYTAIAISTHLNVAPRAGAWIETRAL
ncbi:MAG: hypothetical protein XD84_1686 [Desulfotomaculum sp. 46_80]|nr:MAG: hypothetical protein XD84_1686 [Desulfotomaculum sp. 46_80]